MYDTNAIRHEMSLKGGHVRRTVKQESAGLYDSLYVDQYLKWKRAGFSAEGAHEIALDAWLYRTPVTTCDVFAVIQAEFQEG